MPWNLRPVVRAGNECWDSFADGFEDILDVVAWLTLDELLIEWRDDISLL